MIQSYLQFPVHVNAISNVASAVTVLIARGAGVAWSPEREHDEETHEGLVRFGPERPGMRPNPPGIIRPGLKSGPA